MSMNEKVRRCLDEGERELERHKGLRKMTPDQKVAEAHVVKMMLNYNAITDFRDSGHSDWSAIAAFYALYHGLLAILAQRGYQSRNQSCTFALIEELITKGELRFLTLADSREIFDRDVSTNIQHRSKILDIREVMQYSTKTDLEEQQFDKVKQRTKQIMEKIRQEIEDVIAQHQENS